MGRADHQVGPPIGLQPQEGQMGSVSPIHHQRSTVGMDDLGQAYNVNADTAAAQIAIALKAEKLVSMTDIAGLLRDKEDETTLIPEVEVTEIEGYKSAGIIAGGMIPKIGGMADAIYQGVHEAVIIDGRVPHSILLELFSDRGSGTRFYRRSHRE